MPNNPQDVRIQENPEHAVDLYGPTVRAQREGQDENLGICMLQVDLRAKELERTVEFYQRILELSDNKLDWKNSDSAQSCILDLPYGRLMLTRDEEQSPAGTGSGPANAVVTFIIGSDEAVDNVYRRLKALGDDCVVAGPFFDRFNRYTVVAVDPSGNTIAFCD